MNCIIKSLLFAFIAIPFMGSDLFAQRPFERMMNDLDKMRPRGRILREIFGDNNSSQNRSQAQLEEQRRRALQQQQQRQQQAQQQQRQRNANNGRQPTTATRNRNSNQRNTNQANSQPRSQSNPVRQRAPSGHPARLEFLIRESEDPEGLVVEKIAKTGAAWAAGIRQNDLITKVGGLKTETKEAIGEIIKILEDGDQIEFEYIRSGKKKTAMVQLGDPPETGDGSDGDAPDAESSNASIGNGARARGSVTRNGLNSVVDQTVLRPSGYPSYRNQPASERDRSQQQWQVQPPRSNGPRTQPARTTYPRPANGSIGDLQKQLEAQKQEIERLQRQLQENQTGGTQVIEGFDLTPPSTPPASTEPQPDLDSLLDFDK